LSDLWLADETQGLAAARFRNPPLNYHTDAAIQELIALIEGWDRSDL